MNKIRKNIIITSTVLLVAGFIAFSLYVASRVLNSYSQPTTSMPIVSSTPEQNPELLSILKSINAKYTDELTLVYSDNIDSRGMYSGKTIQVQPNDDAVGLKRTVAHEYLHYVWYMVMTEPQRTAITSKMYALYLNDPEMQVRTDYYENTDSLIPTELFSIYCAESTDAYMLSIVDECNKYIDRSQLVLTR